MNGNFSVILTCFAAGLLGAAAGVMLTWRLTRAWVTAKFESLLQPVVDMSFVQSPAEGVSFAGTADTAQAEQLNINLEQLGNRVTAHFDAQHKAQSDAQQRSDQAMQQALQQIPQLVQQVVQQVVQQALEYQTQQQIERDQALSLRQDRWQAEQERLAKLKDERHASAMQMLLQVPTEKTEKPASQPFLESPLPQISTSQQRTATPPTTPTTPPQAPAPRAVSPPVVARAPEVRPTPIAQPEPVFTKEESTRELTDEELDAFPPELPTEKPRKRILPAPKKPTFRSL